jgi:uncharacterized beta-barrel protein YwiB (DUF1934 family)
MESNHSKKNNSKVGVIALLLLLLVSIGFNVFQYTKHTDEIVAHGSEVDSLTNIKIEVEKELASTNMELEKYKGIASNLDSLLGNANDVLKMQEEKIRNIIGKEKNVSLLNTKLKLELEVLRNIREEYLEKIDSLMVENGTLKAQNAELANTVSGLNSAKQSLEKTVETASMLKVEYIKVTAYKKKGNGKLVESNLAKRTNKIDVCFTILDNKVRQKGEVIAYLRITAPDGKPLAGINKGLVKINNEEIECTSNLKVDYQNEKQNVCLAYDGMERNLESGTYTIDLYIDNNSVHSSSFILK